MTTDTTTPDTASIETIRAIMIRLEVGDADALFILLAADGTSNRLGTGTVNN